VIGGTLDAASPRKELYGMRHAFKAWSGTALIAVTLPLAACAEAEDGGIPGGAGGAAGSAGAGATAGGGGGSGAGSGGVAGSAGTASGGTGGLVDAGPPVTVSGYIKELTLGTDPPKPVADMQVCVYGVPSVPCVSSNGIGYYQIPVPGGNEILLEFTKPTFFPVLRTITTGSADMELGSIPYPTVAQANLFATMVGTALDSAKGQVLAMALKTVILSDGSTAFGGQEGVSAVMSPKSGGGPFYTNDSSLPDTSATATSTTGVGLFANVDPGEVEIEMTHTTKACTRYVDGAWQGSTSTASRVPVIAGYIVGGAVLQCPPY
jgi:hypothetical protein